MASKPLQNTEKQVILKLIERCLGPTVVVNSQKKILYLNEVALTLLGTPETSLLGQVLDMPVDLTDHTTHMSQVSMQQFDGSTLFFEALALKLVWENKSAYLINLQDVTEKKATSELLEHMTEKEFIVDLAARMDFDKKMVHTIKAAKLSEEHMAVLHLNMDNFKTINDVFGKAAGDVVLLKTLALLKDHTRKTDMVACLKGDEFVIVLDHLRKSEYAGVVAHNILNALDEPFEVAGEKIYSNVSIGISVYPLAGNTGVELLQHAEVAMHKAKSHGKNQSYFYSEHLDEQTERWLWINNGLRNALQKDEFYMAYQPIVDLKTGACHGVEALLRWQHPHLGVLYPEEFLPEAEKMNLMVPLGKWVTRRVFSEFSQLDTKPLLFVSVNVTADELSETRTVEDILAALKEFNVDINKIIFELTETSFVNHPERLIKKLDDLFNVRIQLAIDDYGTGYSSLSYLKRLPIAILKIDQSFIQDMDKDPHNKIILQSTIQLAHSLGIKVIAEGVEIKRHADFLKQNKCDYVQGYYFAKPLSLKDTIEFIKKSN
ncbi:MAG: EAL domain-containing protein [Legionella sp.]|nr:EAL domain-containing protein [Legionella sp.]